MSFSNWTVRVHSGDKLDDKAMILPVSPMKFIESIRIVYTLKIRCYSRALSPKSKSAIDYHPHYSFLSVVGECGLGFYDVKKLIAPLQFIVLETNFDDEYRTGATSVMIGTYCHYIILQNMY